MTLVAPSILAANLGRLAEEVKAVEQAGADWIHVDVMDGHFVPNLTMGPDIVRAVRKSTTLPIDVHLMITNPLEFIAAFAKEGANYISFHAEVVSDVEQACARIEEAGCRPGIVVNPPTPVEGITSSLARVAYVLVMSVHPGFAGQAFIREVLPKLTILRDAKREARLSTLLEIDGGINATTAAEARAAGADVLVAGSGVFGQSDYGAAIAAIRTG
jgi:ribulose-phosphate 3-epimerase